MGVITSGSNHVEKSDVQSFLGRIGSIHLQSEKGVREVQPFHELPLEMQEQIGRLVQLLLRSRSLLNHLQNHQGKYNIVYKEDGRRRFLIIAGKTIDLDQAFELPEKNETVDDRKPEDGVLKQIQSLSGPLAPFTDFLSFVRNALSSFATAALANPHSPVALAVDGLGIAGGVVGGIACGGIILSKGVEQIANSKEREETELGVLQSVSGVGYLGFGVSSLMFRISSMVESAAAFTQAVGTFGINPTLYVMNVGFLLLGLYQLAIGGAFRSDFNQVVEKGGTQAGIDFLYANLFLTPEEEKSDNAQEILERKRAHFARRTDSEIVEKIAPKIEELKRKFDAGSVDAKAMQEALGVLDAVSEANYKEIAQATLFILLASLSILSVVAVGPTGTFAFFAALAVLWFIFDCSRTANWTTDTLWKLHELLLGLIIVTRDGKDEEFMKYLYFLDPRLESADERTQAEVYLKALTDMDGICYKLFKRVQKRESEISEQFLIMMQEIRRASINGELNSSEDCVDYLFSSMPQFYEFLAGRLPKENVDQVIGEMLMLAHEGCLARFPEISRLSKAEQLKYAALHLLDALYESTVNVESALVHFEAVREKRENKRDSAAQFMRYLYAIDPVLQEASSPEEARVILQGYAESWDIHFSLFNQMRGMNIVSQGFFDLAYDPEFKSHYFADEMIKYIRESYPEFWELYEMNYSEEKFQSAVQSGLSGWEALGKAYKFNVFAQEIGVRVTKDFLEMMEEIRLAPPPADLNSLKGSMPRFHSFLMRRGTDETVAQALKQSVNLKEHMPEGEKIRRSALYLLSSLYSEEMSRAAIFDRFSPDQVKAIREGTESGLPLLQLGCSLAAKFKILGRGKSAYDATLHPELLLTEDEASILKRHREIQNEAAKQYPQAFMEAMKKNPSLTGKAIQECLEYALKFLETVQINGEEVNLPKQMVKDLDRSPVTGIQWFEGETIKKAKFEKGQKGGEKAILRLREMAAGDERLFLLLSALYAQSAKNFLPAFQQEMEEKEVLTGLYVPVIKVPEQQFIQKEDGSFQIKYHFLFMLMSELDGEPVELPMTITLNLEKESGQWVCRNPEHSGTIHSNGHPDGAGRLSRSSPL